MSFLTSLGVRVNDSTRTWWWASEQGHAGPSTDSRSASNEREARGRVARRLDAARAERSFGGLSAATVEEALKHPGEAAHHDFARELGLF